MTKARPVTIESYREIGTNDIKFRMLEDTIPTDILVFNKSDDGIKKSDDYDVQFTLVNGEGCNLEFVTDQNKPGEPVMFLAQGSATHCPPCPDAPSNTPITNFIAGKPTANTLTVKNKDKDVCYYKFVLRFVDKDTNDIVPYDPIFGNQNGGRSFASALTIGLISGAAAGAATMLLTPAATATSILTGAAVGAVVGAIVALIVGGLGGSPLSGAAAA